MLNYCRARGRLFKLLQNSLTRCFLLNKLGHPVYSTFHALIEVCTGFNIWSCLNPFCASVSCFLFSLSIWKVFFLSLFVFIQSRPIC